MDVSCNSNYHWLDFSKDSLLVQVVSDILSRLYATHDGHIEIGEDNLVLYSYGVWLFDLI